MAGDFAKAGLKSAKSGFQKVPQQIYFDRRKQCAKCTKKAQCPHCKCILWLKCSMATEQCPLGYWPKYENDKRAQVGAGLGVATASKKK